MKSSFNQIFDVEVTHSYFEGGICKCLQFTPGTTTSQLFRRFDFKMRENISGFDLYCNSQNTIAGLLNYISSITGVSCFDFNIATNASSFYYFTDLPTDSINSLLYDSHSAQNKLANNTIQLAPESAEDANTVYLGSLTIHFDDIIKLSTIKGIHFKISYQARATQWQYYIINSSSMQLLNPQIAGKSPIDFTGPEDVVLDNGQQAMLFSSGDKLIPLSILADNKFDLVSKSAANGNKSAASKIIFKGLPIPDPMRTSNGTGNKVSSKMYVYI
jgi:hypothetical protein